LQAALVATSLTSIPLAFVNDTVVVLTTCVLEIFTNCPLEEPLTTFTAAENHIHIQDGNQDVYTHCTATYIKWLTSTVGVITDRAVEMELTAAL